MRTTPPPLQLSAQAMADLLCTLIVLCRGVDEHQQPIWAYLCLKPSMAAAFKVARDAGGFDIADYGTVLESGNGAEPPPEVVQRMQRDYGVNPHFEQDLLDAVASYGDSAEDAAPMV